MPYKLGKRNGKTCVLKDDGSVVKCHDDPADAKAHLRALYKNVKSDAALVDEPMTLTAALDGDDVFAGAIRLGGWKWSADEYASVIQNIPQLLSGFKWATNPEAIEELVRLLSGWRFSIDENPVFGLQRLLSGWRFTTDETDTQELALKLLGGWKWSVGGGAPFRS
jgi:hypothetical protein